MEENVVELNRSAEVVWSDGPDSSVAGVGDPNSPPKIPIVMCCLWWQVCMGMGVMDGCTVVDVDGNGKSGKRYLREIM